VDALLMALWLGQAKKPVLVHSYQGEQYIARDWLDFPKAISCKSACTNEETAMTMP
jgi:hypothetical protein